MGPGAPDESRNGVDYESEVILTSFRKSHGFALVASLEGF